MRQIAVLLDVEAEVRQERREDVLPDRVAGAGVVEADRALVRLRLQALEEGEVLGRDHLARPLRGEHRAP